MELVSETVEWLRDYVADCEPDSKSALRAAELADALDEQIKTLSRDTQKFWVMPDGKDDSDCPTSPEAMPLSAIGAHIATLRAMYRRQGYFSNTRQDHIPLDELEFKIVPEEFEEVRVFDGEDAEEWERRSDGQNE